MRKCGVMTLGMSLGQVPQAGVWRNMERDKGMEGIGIHDFTLERHTLTMDLSFGNKAMEKDYKS